MDETEDASTYTYGVILPYGQAENADEDDWKKLNRVISYIKENNHVALKSISRNYECVEIVC